MIDIINNAVELLKYNSMQPLLFSSGLFLFLFCIFCFFYQSLRDKFALRILYVVLFSLYFYYKTSGIFVLLLIGLSFSDYTIGYLIHNATGELRRKMLLILSITINLGILCYFKYTNFFITILNDFSWVDPLELENIFLPVGVSFFTFQSMSYVIDVYRRNVEPTRRWIHYLFYLSFFPQLVAGPIVRAKDFLPQIYYKSVYVSREMFSRGFMLILSGLFKKAVISDFISQNFVDRIFDNPLMYSGVENLLGVYGYAMQIYCDFSGYSDMAIGIALLLGFRFNKNFDSPYKSATITEFWRRWHISLSDWLKDYLYISLGGNRKGRLRTYFNLMMTMLLGGLWHGAAMRFILWGAIHGVALAIHKMVMSLLPSFKAQGQDMSPWRRAIGIFLTFHLVCFAWIFFRAEDMERAGEIIMLITTDLDFSMLPTIAVGYGKVFILMAIGYIMHFLPRKVDMLYAKVVDATPFVVKAAALALLIWYVMQIKSSDITPFIYFQF